VSTVHINIEFSIFFLQKQIFYKKIDSNKCPDYFNINLYEYCETSNRYTGLFTLCNYKIDPTMAIPGHRENI